MLDKELKSKINKLWDKFWSNGISNPLTAIEQISYLIFMKRLEDQDVRREQDAILKGTNHESIFKGKEDYKWSEWRDMSADQILPHVRNEVFPFLMNLGDEDSLYRKYMKDAVFVIPTGSLLKESVKIIDELNIKQQNLDTKGDIYEHLLSELQISGKNGQFRTPRHIIRMMIKILNPKYGDNILDPACGTAGFLINTYEYILRNNTSEDLIKIDEEGNEYNFVADKLDTNKKNILYDSINGIDFDPSMVRISIMNLMMHGIENPQIKQENALSSRYDQRSQYDVILANPPFKGSVNESELSDQFTVKTTKTELLFLELMYNSLAVGGRCAVIVPDGVLFGNTNAHEKIRKIILEKCRLDAVVSMPSGVFKPYAGVSTGILFFTKGEPTKKVRFYDMKSDGFSLDDKREYLDGEGDIPDIVEKLKQTNEEFDDRKLKCFDVPVEEIKKKDYDLSINRYKKVEYKKEEYDPPKVIKKKILELENKIIDDLNDLDA